MIWLVVGLTGAAGAQAEGRQLLDRIVARVSGVAITQTDVEAALALGVVEPQPGEDRLAAGTRQLIDRQLMMAEVARFPPPPPSEADVDALVQEMRARAGTDFDDLMRRTGLDEQRLREIARDSLRIAAYVEQRFGAVPQVSLEEARTYYDQHREQFARGGAVPPFEAVEAEARRAAADERRRTMVGRWVEDLRLRGEVVEVSPRR